MNCRKCKATIKDGEDFCRKCATPVEILDSEVKPLTKKTSFINTSKLKEIEKKIKVIFDPKYDDKPFVPGQLSNKELIYKDANNREQATKENIISVSLILLGIVVAIIIIFIVISRL